LRQLTRVTAHGAIQTARGLCTDEAPHVEIDALLAHAVDAVKDVEAERDHLLDTPLRVGSRVTHLDPAGKPLPMAGTVVAVKTDYLVQWDDAEPRPTSGWTPTYYYPGAVLRDLE
jgi:hypothetical protein